MLRVVLQLPISPALRDLIPLSSLWVHLNRHTHTHTHTHTQTLELTMLASASQVLGLRCVSPLAWRISEFEASLVYRVSSRTATATQRNPVSKNNNNKKSCKAQRQTYQNYTWPLNRDGKTQKSLDRFCLTASKKTQMLTKPTVLSKTLNHHIWRKQDLLRQYKT